MRAPGLPPAAALLALLAAALLWSHRVVTGTAPPVHYPTTTEAEPRPQRRPAARLSVLGRASAALRPGGHKRSATHGADGTVAKDMGRGPPLRDLLPEDEAESSSSSDDGDEDEDEFDSSDDGEDSADGAPPREAAPAAAAGGAPEEESAASTSRPAYRTPTATIDAEAAAVATWRHDHQGGKKNRAPPADPHRKKEDKPPRAWESNRAARVRIVAAGEEEESSSSSSGSEDSGDDEDEDEGGTRLVLPDLAALSPDAAAAAVLASSSSDDGLLGPLRSRLAAMFDTATSHACRAKIAAHAALFVRGFAEETKFPFDDFYHPNTCDAIERHADWDNLPTGVTLRDVQSRTYRPPKEDVPEGTYLEDPATLRLLYVILTHDHPEATIRLLESVYVPGVTNYVIHVDGKERSDATYARLAAYAAEKNAGADGEYIRLVPEARRVRVNWGGFSMVDATLKALHTAFGLDRDGPEEDAAAQGPDNPRALAFHKLVHIASTTYPLASNAEIRDSLASYPLDANFLHIILRPNNPSPSVWNYFVECDDALHRIYRLPGLNRDKGNGVDIYTSSQWFIASRELAWYLARPPPGSFAEYYLEYIEHVVVADESFFGTIVRNTRFCATLHNDNFLHLQFDRWENEANGARDQRKCVMKNRDHCGRSPMTLTLDYLPTLELSGDLFARKFDDEAEPLVKDYIDRKREKDEARFRKEAELAREAEEKNTTQADLPLEPWEFQGEGVLIVAKETLADDTPLCMGLPPEGNKVLLRPCFKEDVIPTLSPEWESGAVIIEEIEGLNRWDLGPCSSDGELKRNGTTGELEMTPGEYSAKGPSCGIKLGDGPRAGRCLDVQSDRHTPGGLFNVFPCYARWHQLFSFGNGTLAPRGAIHASLPFNIVRAQKEKKKEKKKKEKKKKEKKEELHPHLCLGVAGRGDMEEAWIEFSKEEMEQLDPWEHDDVERYPNGRKSLQLWSGQQLQTTPCSNAGAVIEWYYVPFIVEEYPEDPEEQDSVSLEETDVEETDIEL